MTTDKIGLFQAMNAKMQYLDQRQKVISQNIANADTPHYQAKDLGKLDFGTVLDKVSSSSKVPAVSIATTDKGHIGFNGNMGADPKVRKDKITYEVSPDKNGVIVEEQMVKANDVQMNYSLMLNLYKSNMDMMRTSLGRR
jgi:flagellar basal-body rod protein FlgB